MKKKINFKPQRLISIIVQAVASACLKAFGMPEEQAIIIGSSLGAVINGISLIDKDSSETILSALEKSISIALDNNSFELPGLSEEALREDVLSPKKIIHFMCQTNSHYLLREQILKICKEDPDFNSETFPVDEFVSDISKRFEEEVLNNHELASYASYCILRNTISSSEVRLANQQYGAMQVLPYLKAYLRFPQMEYLVKLRLYRLAGSCVRWPGNYYAPYGESVLKLSGKTAEQVLGVPKELIPLLQRQNPDPSQLEMVRTLSAQGVRKDLDELLVWCEEHDIEEKELVAVPLRYMTFHRWSRYLASQLPLWRERHPSYWTRSDPLCDLATEYRDYLRMCQRLDRDLKNDFVLFPRDLKTQHDRMTERSRRLEREANDTAILRQYEKNLKLKIMAPDRRVIAGKRQVS